MDIHDKIFVKELIKKPCLAVKNLLSLLIKIRISPSPQFGQIKRETTLGMIRRYVRGVKQI